jgi:antitoxin component HigA of HigAB toxin-antitoxin module
VRLREEGFLEKFLRTEARDLCDVIGFRSVVRSAVARKRALAREEERRRRS